MDAGSQWGSAMVERGVLAGNADVSVGGGSDDRYTTESHRGGNHGGHDALLKLCVLQRLLSLQVGGDIRSSLEIT